MCGRGSGVRECAKVSGRFTAQGRAGAGAVAAARFVPYENLQTKGYGAHRNVLNQAATMKGTKR